MSQPDARFQQFPGDFVFHLRWTSALIVLFACLIGGVMNSVVLAAPAETESKSDAHHVDSHRDTAQGDAAHSDSAHAGEDGHHQPYSLWADLPLWSLIAFVGFLFAIKGLGLWDLLVSSMATREKTETESIAAAETDLHSARTTLRLSRGRLEALDEQIRETMAEADRDARSTRNDIIAIAEQEAQASVDRATLEIDRVRDQSLNEIFETVADRVAEATERRLHAGLQPDDHHRLIDSMLNDLAIR